MADDINGVIAAQAEENATKDPTSTETPAKVKVNLGPRTFEFDDPQLAKEVQSAFDSLHGSYGAQLDDFRRQALQTIGAPPAPVPQQPTQRPLPKLNVPDGDLLFSNKAAWAEALSREIAQALDGVRHEFDSRLEAGVQVALDVTDQKLSQRDAFLLQRELERDVYTNHPELRRTFTAPDGTSISGAAIFNAVREEMAPVLKHLPANVAYDRIGDVAARQFTALAPQTRTQTTSPAPRLLSSAQRGVTATTGATQHQPKTLSEMIADAQEKATARRGRAA